MATIFVYGSLLRGGDNHGTLARATFLGEARTEAAFDLPVGGLCESYDQFVVDVYQTRSDTSATIDSSRSLVSWPFRST